MSPRHLLVIDPNRSAHEFLKGVLQREDRAIENAYDRNQALDCLKATAFDLVLAGQSANGFDGLKLVREVHSLQPGARVIVTGDPDPNRVLRALRARAYSYFHNPPAPGPLSDMVQQALETKSWRDDIRVISAVTDWISLDVRCKLEAADRAVHFFREVLAELSTQVREDTAAAMRELTLNAIEHGGKNDPRKRVRVSLVRAGKTLIGQVEDPGKGFSLSSLPHAAISNPDDSPIQHVEIRAETGQRPGGFGILMTRNMVDELVYNQRGNSVLFVKRF